MSQVTKIGSDFEKPRAYKSVNSSEIKSFPSEEKEKGFTDWIYDEIKIIKDLFSY